MSIDTRAEEISFCYEYLCTDTKNMWLKISKSTLILSYSGAKLTSKYGPKVDCEIGPKVDFEISNILISSILTL